MKYFHILEYFNIQKVTTYHSDETQIQIVINLYLIYT